MGFGDILHDGRQIAHDELNDGRLAVFVMASASLFSHRHLQYLWREWLRSFTLRPSAGWLRLLPALEFCGLPLAPSHRANRFCLRFCWRLPILSASASISVFAFLCVCRLFDGRNKFLSTVMAACSARMTLLLSSDCTWISRIL